MAITYVIVTGNNNVNFKNTRETLIDKSAKFRAGVSDFGAGNEDTYKCPGCSRTLPVVLFHLDHIRSKSRYSSSNLGLQGSNSFKVYDQQLSKVTASVSATGGYATISSGSMYNPKIGYVQAAELWQNDLANLQLLCALCNESKGSKDWQEWGKSDFSAKPLSSYL